MSSIFLYLIIFFNFILPLNTIAAEKDNFLVISDIHLNMNTKHLMDIAPKERDGSNVLDKRSFVDFLEQIKTNIEKKRVSKPSFIILQGDNGLIMD